jgi:DNA-binding response OmpR family regulator
MSVKILLAEDDQNFGDVLKSYLSINGYNVDLAKDGEEAFNFFQKQNYNLCILDVMMPKMDGFQLAEQIVSLDLKTPIIFLTAKTLKEDVIEGFKIGADDYITKPFNSEELLYRIKAVLKRSDTKKPKEEIKEFNLGKYHFSFPVRILTFTDDNGKQSERKLSPKEAQLLKLFCLHKNEVLPRKTALRNIWGKNDYFTARSMDVFVTKLRKYLENDPNLEIINIHGNGFRLVERNKD